jgi:hypothetical protein
VVVRALGFDNNYYPAGKDQRIESCVGDGAVVAVGCLASIWLVRFLPSAATWSVNQLLIQVPFAVSTLILGFTT